MPESSKIEYRCPKDKEVLYTGSGDEPTKDKDIGIFSDPPPSIAETPEQCPKCGTHYYKWECLKREVSAN